MGGQGSGRIAQQVTTEQTEYFVCWQTGGLTNTDACDYRYASAVDFKEQGMQKYRGCLSCPKRQEGKGEEKEMSYEGNKHYKCVGVCEMCGREMKLVTVKGHLICHGCRSAVKEGRKQLPETTLIAVDAQEKQGDEQEPSRCSLRVDERNDFPKSARNFISFCLEDEPEINKWLPERAKKNRRTIEGEILAILDICIEYPILDR
jgi:hypothetical protein